MMLFLLAFTGSALAQPGYPPAPAPPPQPKAVWDSRGWTMLGEQTVSGGVDSDTIRVGRYQGKFDKLQVVVLDSDLELLGFTITYADGTRYDPKLAQFFKEGQRTRAFDMPPAAPVIDHIDLRYRNLPGGGRARVQVWAKGNITVTPPPKPVWDSTGWQMLGEQQVSGGVDHDTIRVPRYEGKFAKLQLVALDSDLELLGFTIVFADGTRYDPKVTHFFKEGQRTRAINMPPQIQQIDHIDLRYRNLPGGGRARVQVWGQKIAVAEPAWDPKGWVLLGERTIDGRIDHDRIDVPKRAGKFTKLTIVALDSDFELIDFSVQFGRGAPWHPSLRHLFKEGQRTRAIDFPGDERTIKAIDFKYANLRGGGRARIQVWAKPDVAGSVFDSRGWTLLGERTVDGNVDHDRIEVARYEGKFRKLSIVVLDSDLQLLDFDVKMGRGPSFHPSLRHQFKEGSRSRVIDLPGDDRVIKWIDLKYKNVAGGGRAKIQVWAK
ncbi:MAG TPA: hypothetical protein VFQ53_13345 [Kofleriaceae bacterium]|nr:hypothetical protein [Kofleriaceae bacterium]